MAAAWSIVDYKNENSEDYKVRAEREGDRPVWKNFAIMDVPGSPKDTSNVVQVKNET